jgi:hypothetical protein
MPTDWKALYEGWRYLSEEMRNKIIDTLDKQAREKTNELKALMLKEPYLEKLYFEKMPTNRRFITEMPSGAAIPTPTVPTPTPIRETRGLTGGDINRLQDEWNNRLFRALGRVPPNSSSTFRVEVDKLKNGTYTEAKDALLKVADDIIAAFQARQLIRRAPMAGRIIRPGVEEEGGLPREGVSIARIPPAEVPSHALEPEEMKFPRGPSSREREELWKAFRYRMQEQGYSAWDFEDEFDNYIMGTQFRDWKDLQEKFNIFASSIIRGEALPPLWQWRGIPIPVGLEGVLRKTPLERLQDAIVHFTSVVIKNQRWKGKEPTLMDLQMELVDRGLIPPDMMITPTSPLYGEIKNALTAAYNRKDIWLTNISLEELTRFLET